MTEARIAVRLQPRAQRDRLVRWQDDVLVARVSASPVDGRANEALCRLIAKKVGVAASKVAVVRGERSRDKVVRVDGIDPEALREALGG